MLEREAIKKVVRIASAGLLIPGIYLATHQDSFRSTPSKAPNTLSVPEPKTITLSRSSLHGQPGYLMSTEAIDTIVPDRLACFKVVDIDPIPGITTDSGTGCSNPLNPTQLHLMVNPHVATNGDHIYLAMVKITVGGKPYQIDNLKVKYRVTD